MLLDRLRGFAATARQPSRAAEPKLTLRRFEVSEGW
jgi:hypothetical protein